ncbi:DUF3592 domain-containing protein [Spirochaetota bacterium]
MFVYKFVGTMVMIMGLVVGSMATYSSKTWSKLGVNVVENPVVTKGTVIGINKKDIYRAPFVRFKAKNGRTYRFLSQFDRNVDFFKLKKGQKIEIVYDKKNPKIAQENTFWGRYGPRVIPGGFGVIIILIGLFTFTRGRKK